MDDTRRLVAHVALPVVEISGDGIALSNVAPCSIVSVALRRGDSDMREAVQLALGTALPDIGRAAHCDIAGGATLLGLQLDQWFLRMTGGDDPVGTVRAAVGDMPALTDQSDAWAALAIEGPRATVALERVCRLDLHAEAFPPGHVARTAMEHMAIILIREDEERFVLLSPRSSADSFAHAMETSLRNVS